MADTFPCPGCGTPMTVVSTTGTRKGWRMCSDCYQDVLEWTAYKLRPGHNPAVMHDFTELQAILGRLYCFCIPER